MAASKGSQHQRSILLAIPIAGPSLELHRFVVDHFIELGDSGGQAVWWRPIASPTLADPIYKQLRSPELVLSDQNDARKYRRYCQKAGSEDNYVRGEYFKLARTCGIREDQRPTLVLQPQPACGNVATLRLAPAAFETAERRRALACFLHQELGESRVRQFAQDGEFGPGSVVQMQYHMDSIAGIVAKSIAKDRDIPRRMWDSYLSQTGLTERPNPEIHTTARAWRRDGSLFLRTETNGKLDGEVVFPLQDGRTTLQMHLMWRLLLEWPRGLKYRDLGMELYKDEVTVALTRGDKDSLQVVGARIRSLIHDIRCDKLEAACINPEILPTIMGAKSRSHTVRLRFADLDRHQLGHLSRPRS